MLFNSIGFPQIGNPTLKTVSIHKETELGFFNNFVCEDCGMIDCFGETEKCVFCEGKLIKFVPINSRL